MTQIVHVIQHLLQHNPQSNIARLALFNYLNYLTDPQVEFSATIMRDFHLHALSFSHWQNYRELLTREVRSILKGISDQHPLNWKVAEIPLAADFQVTRIEQLDHFSKIVGCHLQGCGVRPEDLRILGEVHRNLVCLVRGGDPFLTVYHLPRLVTYEEGRVVPMRMELKVSYDANLEMRLGCYHHLEIGPFTSMRFCVHAGEIRGKIVRGYSFSEYGSVSGGSLEQHPRLFYPLKRLEAHFISRQSDPFYRDLTELLEKFAQSIRQGHRDKAKAGQALLERARMALEMIFNDDKILKLLVRDLETALDSIGIKSHREMDHQNSPNQNNQNQNNPNTQNTQNQYTQNQHIQR